MTNHFITSIDTCIVPQQLILIADASCKHRGQGSLSNRTWNTKLLECVLAGDFFCYSVSTKLGHSTAKIHSQRRLAKPCTWISFSLRMDLPLESSIFEGLLWAISCMSIIPSYYRSSLRKAIQCNGVKRFCSAPGQSCITSTWVTSMHWPPIIGGSQKNMWEDKGCGPTATIQHPSTVLHNTTGICSDDILIRLIAVDIASIQLKNTRWRGD